jgi:hypothetical protein
LPSITLIKLNWAGADKHKLARRLNPPSLVGIHIVESTYDKIIAAEIDFAGKSRLWVKDSRIQQCSLRKKGSHVPWLPYTKINEKTKRL